ncbi:hypothetical protein O6Y00_18295 [Sphingomonas faeni]
MTGFEVDLDTTDTTVYWRPRSSAEGSYSVPCNTITTCRHGNEIVRDKIGNPDDRPERPYEQILSLSKGVPRPPESTPLQRMTGMLLHPVNSRITERDYVRTFVRRIVEPQV